MNINQTKRTFIIKTNLKETDEAKNDSLVLVQHQTGKLSSLGFIIHCSWLWPNMGVSQV